MKLKSLLLSSAVIGGTLLTGAVVANADTVTVKAGDTVSEIASRNNTSVEAIQQLNHLKNVNLIFVGDQLTVNPGQSNTAASNANQGAPQSAQASQPVAPSTSQSVSQAPQAQGPVAGGNGSSAKAIIAGRESGGSYSARNGQYIGKYQLSSAYLNGDYSPANQERVADNYVSSRYGSWDNALNFWNQHGWY